MPHILDNASWALEEARWRAKSDLFRYAKALNLSISEAQERILHQAGVKLKMKPEIVLKDYADKTKKPAQLPPNPKQAYGDKKVPLHLIPSAGLIYEALAFKDGANKYGPYNWRDKAVEAETYIGAALRHLLAWQDREEFDPESGKHHLGHARACLGILCDALEVDNLIDNRPKKGNAAALLRKLAL